MNKPTYLKPYFTVVTETPELYKAIQLIAVGYGYKWSMREKNEINSIHHLYLCFETNIKEITYADTIDEASAFCFEIVNGKNLQDVITLFEQPVNQVLDFNDNISILSNGDVLIENGDMTIEAVEFDELVFKRKQFLGESDDSNKKLPLINFKYNSPSTGKSYRNILVTNANDTYFEGFDVDDGYKFKKFKKERLIGEVLFVGFEGKPTK